MVLALMVLLVAASHRVGQPDEGDFSSPAFNLARHGFFGTTIVDPEVARLPGIRERTYWIMPLYPLLQAGWLLVFPASLLSIRLFTILLVPLVAWQLYRLAVFLTGDRAVALIASALLPLEYAFLFTSSWARPDMLCLFCGLTGLTAYLSTRERSLTWALVWSSFWIALSGLSHPNGVLHLAALAVLVLCYDRRRLRWRMLLPVGAVYLLVALPWLIYIAQDFASFLGQLSANALNNSRFTGSWNPLRWIADELVGRYAYAYGLLSPQWLPRLKSVALLSYLAAFAVAVCHGSLRGRAGVAVLLSLWAAYFAFQCVFNQKLGMYLVHILPVYTMLLAVVSVYLWRRFPFARFWLTAWLVFSALLQAGGMAWASWEKSGVLAQQQAAAFLDRHASRARLIYASSSLLYPLHFDPRLVDDHFVGVLTGKRPDVIVCDPFLRGGQRTIAQRRPRDFALIEHRLAEYRLVFETGGYQVFFSPEFASTTTTEGRMPY
jgi:hypothetical protein